MRRSVLALTVALAVMVSLASVALAIGPGGWDHLGVGATSATASLNGAVYALNADAPGELIVGGNFTSAGGNANASRIAAWNGTAWSALAGTPLANGAVFAIAYHAGKVYAGGTFTNAGGNPNADFLAVWDGTSWAPFCNAVGPAFGGSVAALQIIGNTLYVGGAFGNGAGIAAADYLLACDLTTGASRSTVAKDGEFTGAVYALTADSNGTLYAGGNFINLNTIPAADHVAAYDGTWHAMGSSPAPSVGAVDSIVRSLASHGTDVYIGTDATNVAAIPAADHVVRWDGSAWKAVGSNGAGSDGWFTTTTFINALTTAGSLVFAAGSFQNADGVATADGVAYFDGSAWRPIGSNGAGNGPVIGNLTAVAAFRGQLDIGGSFTSAGGDARASYLASYALTLPDVRIGLKSTGPFSGNGVYSPTAIGESRTVPIAGGKTGTFYVNIQNDGLIASGYTIKSTGGARGITVRGYRGATDITASVRAGTYSTGAIAPRASVTLKFVITVSGPHAGTMPFLIKATPTTPGTPPDAVKATLNTG